MKNQTIKNEHKLLIVSLTSYPARINTLSSVLKSLYNQSLKPDEIIVWLAKEQFPRLEDDLPEEILCDLKQSLFELRWCEDLGSHKKYFYAMQEYPHDIIVTVDDDQYYPPDTIETLYHSYKKHPHAISANRVELLTFDRNGNIYPPHKWIADFNLIKDEPSLQLMAIGSAGILYPPKTHDERIFDRKLMEQLCRNNGILFLNDAWLKANELLCEIPVVFTGGHIVPETIPGTWEVALKKDTTVAKDVQKKELELWERLKEIYDGEDGLLAKLNSIKSLPNYVGNEDTLLEKAAIIFRKANDYYVSNHNHNLFHYISYTILELNKEISLGLSKEKVVRYIPKYQESLKNYTVPEGIPLKFLCLDALKTYGVLLSPWINNESLKSKDSYQQMMTTWVNFLANHKHLHHSYFEGFSNFLREAKRIRITNRYYCPCCGTYFNEFEPFRYWKQPNYYNPSRYQNADNDVLCPNCKSSPRHRILVYWMEKHIDEFKGKSIIHFAEEPCIKRWFVRNGIVTISADLYEKAHLKIDIEDTKLKDCSVSIIICNHVLEHVKDYKRALNELHRILRDDGMIILSMPIDRSYADVYEDPSINTSEGRRNAFGQADHYRIFGNNTKELLESFNFDVTVVEGDTMPEEIKPVIGAANYNANWFYVLKKYHR